MGPALAAVALQVEGAAAMVDNQPDLAKDVLQRLGHEVTGVLDDVRRIVHDLVPPVLDALGLEGALRQQAAAFSSAASDGSTGLEVTVLTREPLGELPAGVELTAYRIGCEALTNVTKHADARRCTISLALRGERLLLTVDDDGVGLHAGTYGVGTLSMIERATAIGGTCRLETSPWGGVRVAAGLPVAPSATPASRQEVAR
ncbi:sensor histidine kinase [Flexivirga alba]|uniref:histidine kinase n=1 Tax=Flexivirga alba TaxID=702742 RepID=A0ABW2AH15_9MICO